MNPRVSRSSALASKATGFPIARIGTKLAVGYRLDELPNDITKTTPASLRAGARLRGGEDPALRLREVPDRRPDAHHADEVGRRGRWPSAAPSRRRSRRDSAGWRSTGPAGSSAPRPADDRLADDDAGDAALAALRTPTPERIFQIKRALQLGALGGGDRRADRHRSLVPRPAGRAGRGGDGMGGRGRSETRGRAPSCSGG